MNRNEYIGNLLDILPIDRENSKGLWASAFDAAMATWEKRHPKTRPPAFIGRPAPPPCFDGDLAPIYEEKLK